MTKIVQYYMYLASARDRAAECYKMFAMLGNIDN